MIDEERKEREKGTGKERKKERTGSVAVVDKSRGAPQYPGLVAGLGPVFPLSYLPPVAPYCSASQVQPVSSASFSLSAVSSVWQWWSLV